jgi:diadenosine tetraphosphate (Ap4A) HIT family hydrolase
MNEDWKKDRFKAIEQNTNPMVLTKMKSGYAVIGDTQFLPGYCVLLAYPRVSSLEELTFEQRGLFLQDMSLLGEAIQHVTSPLRMNYSIYGNSDDFLHAHVVMTGSRKKESLIQFGSILKKCGPCQSSNIIIRNT